MRGAGPGSGALILWGQHLLLGWVWRWGRPSPRLPAPTPHSPVSLFLLHSGLTPPTGCGPSGACVLSSVGPRPAGGGCKPRWPGRDARFLSSVGRPPSLKRGPHLVRPRGCHPSPLGVTQCPRPWHQGWATAPRDSGQRACGWSRGPVTCSRCRRERNKEIWWFQLLNSLRPDLHRRAACSCWDRNAFAASIPEPRESGRVWGLRAEGTTDKVGEGVEGYRSMTFTRLALRSHSLLVCLALPRAHSGRRTGQQSHLGPDSQARVSAALPGPAM